MGVVIHRCLAGDIRFGDGGTFAAGHREVGFSIKRQKVMVARHLQPIRFFPKGMNRNLGWLF